MRAVTVSLLAAFVVMSLAGCSGNKKMLAQRDQQITDLENEVRQLKSSMMDEKNRADGLHEELNKALAELEKNKKLLLEQKEGLSKITLPDAVTFSSGSNRLTKEGVEILDRIWGVLAKYPDRRIVIEGHTDNVPIAVKFRNKYRSNWELSSARAHTVLHHLMTKHKADPKRLSAVGYGEYQPIASNDTKDGKTTNRRVVIAVRDKM